MNVYNVHERRIFAPPGRVEALLGDLDRVWPDGFAAEPEDGGLRVGRLLWEPVERDPSPAAFRIADPEEFAAEHWFELEDDGLGGTTLRHTIMGEAGEGFEAEWTGEVEPVHNALVEALFDRVEDAAA